MINHIQNCAYGFPGNEESFVSPWEIISLIVLRGKSAFRKNTGRLDFTTNYSGYLLDLCPIIFNELVYSSLILKVDNLESRLALPSIKVTFSNTVKSFYESNLTGNKFWHFYRVFIFVTKQYVFALLSTSAMLESSCVIFPG